MSIPPLNFALLENCQKTVRKLSYKNAKFGDKNLILKKGKIEILNTDNLFRRICAAV